MKRKIAFLLFCLLMPFSVMAYSSYIVPGGATLGVSANMKGVMIVGFYKTKGKFNKGDNPLKTGDYILEINGEDASSIDKMTKLINKYGDKDSVTITFEREGKKDSTNFNIIYEDNKYKTGLYVKDSIKGIGTLSYVDPETMTYGLLGHEVLEGNTMKMIDIDEGFTFFNKIIGIDKSFPGYAGSKLADFNEDDRYGSIIKNTKYGIFGIYEKDIDDETLKVGTPKIGQAQIRTVVSGNKVETFPIEITKINEEADTKNITFKITSEELINKTGGVVQGMSGSPIIQDNEIVGVLTHVIVDNPMTGYGIFITKMLEEGDK